MKPFYLLLIAVPAIGLPASAQNSDLGILIGVAPLKAVSTVSASGISTQYYANLQIDYAFQVALKKDNAFYIELPLAATYNSGTRIGAGIDNRVRSILFFTPGIRWKMFVKSRVSLYASLGGGAAVFGSSRTTIGPGISTGTTSHVGPALDFGGGIDFRLTRLLSIRVEGRDYLTRSGTGGYTGRHHAAMDVGLGFHF
jgi:hypothetical protein